MLLGKSGRGRATCLPAVTAENGSGYFCFTKADIATESGDRSHISLYILYRLELVVA